MKLAVLSGKGGTGKTLLATNLSAVIPECLYIDCDVEAPNGRLFFKPDVQTWKEVTVKRPVIDDDLCNGCRICTDFCRFNAMAYMGKRVKVFQDICHSCGGCSLLCPQGAISERDKTVGIVEYGTSMDTCVATGVMNIGEASGVPIIEHLQAIGSEYQGHVVIDCPPGSACVVMESIKKADYCLIVAEATIFGLHNMKLVYELASKMNKPCGLVINKSYGHDLDLEDYCRTKKIPVIGRIPYDSSLATLGSQGKIAVRESHKYRDMFRSIHLRLMEEVAYEAVTDLKR